MNGKVNKRINDIVYISMFAAITAVCSLISMPFTIPFTLQTFAVFFTLFMLGGRRGMCAICAYICLGLAGLPVFSGFMGGFSVLFGATGGYIIGFFFAALIYWSFERFLGKSKSVMLVSAALGLLVSYIVGSLWYAFVFMDSTGNVGFTAALLQCVAPFIIPDILKIALAFFLQVRLKRFIK